MIYTNFETAKRHDFIEQSIENADTLLRCDENLRVLGKTATKNALEAIGRMFIPNVRGEKLNLLGESEKAKDFLLWR